MQFDEADQALLHDKKGLLLQIQALNFCLSSLQYSYSFLDSVKDSDLQDAYLKIFDYLSELVVSMDLTLQKLDAY